MTSTQKGIIFAIGAYISWGLGTIYFKMLTNVPAKEMLSHRILWSFLLLGFIIVVSKRLPILKTMLQNPQKLMMLICSGALIACNWFVFIWAIGNDQLLEASLGYYINPLLTILLGLAFFKERLSRLQWMSLVLAFTGVMIQIIMVGTLPWISLTLAVTFSVYGVIRKKANVDSFAGMLIEIAAFFPVAVYYLFINDNSISGDLLHNASSLNMLLMMAGIITTTPLILFSAAASRLNLSALGFLQYITPSMIWLLAVFVYHEPVTQNMLVTFCFIWAALVCFSFDGLYQHRYGAKLATAA